ncbi:unnamed protein product [Owenia fusiformis]|uniref:Uncharacterized protein n=1 Tax=Owenia fusiformis TaxID=6347 RepID=A0A8J1TVQ7_OWEFU|nr:unnamed protein product [Owenia fusiformis]
MQPAITTKRKQEQHQTMSGNDSSNATDILEFYHSTYPLYKKHWDKFDEISPAIRGIISLVMISIGLVGALGNGVVIAVFGGRQQLQKPSYIFVLNLAISDLYVAALGCPLNGVSSMQGRWVFGDVMCKIYAASVVLSGLVSISTLAALAVDRYFAISTLFTAKRKITKERAFSICMFIWLHAAFWAFAPLLGWNEYVPEGYGYTCSADFITPTPLYQSWIMGVLCIGCIFPLGFIIISYSKIFSIVRKQHNDFRNMDRTMNQQRVFNKRRTYAQKVAKCIVILVCLYLATWTPYAVISLIGTFGDAGKITPVVALLPCIAAKMAVIYNPIVYSLTHPNFKHLLAKKMPCFATISTSAGMPSASGSYTSKLESDVGRPTRRESDRRRKPSDSSCDKQEMESLLKSLRQAGSLIIIKENNKKYVLTEEGLKETTEMKSLKSKYGVEMPSDI